MYLPFQKWTGVKFSLTRVIFNDTVLTNMKQTFSTLVRLANLRDPAEAERFKNKLDGYVPDDLSGWSARNIVRQIWHGGEEGNRLVTMLLAGQTTLASTVNQISKAIAAKAETPLTPESAQFLSAPIRADWSRGELLYKGRFGLQRDLFGLLKCSDRARVCARPECPAPYFFLDLKRRKSARYCGPDCSEARDRESKKKSWHRHPEWKKPRRKGGKR